MSGDTEMGTLREGEARAGEAPSAPQARGASRGNSETTGRLRVGSAPDGPAGKLHAGPAPQAIAEAETRGAVDPAVVLLTAPASAAAEQYRVLALRLEAEARMGRRRIALTSAVAGEGVTVTAVNTALALAREGGLRVALVDANFRAAPGRDLASLLGIEARVGLADVARGTASLDETAWRLGGGDLQVVPAGGARRDLAHALVGEPRLGETLTELGRRANLVLVDAPAVLPAADLARLARHIDGVVLVIRAGRTPREVVDLALEALAGVHLIGCVLVGIEAEAGTAWRLLAEHDRRLGASRRRPRPALPPPRADHGEPGSDA